MERCWFNNAALQQCGGGEHKKGSVWGLSEQGMGV
jgi:hypothetical protein